MRPVLRIEDYRPQPLWHRAHALRAQLARFGLRPGRRKLYGTVVHKSVAGILRPLLADIVRLRSRQEAETIAAMPWSAETARIWAQQFRAELEAKSQARKEMKAEQTRLRQQEKRASKVYVRGPYRQGQRTIRVFSSEMIENALLLFDEGLAPEQISKALHLPRTRIQEWIRQTKRSS